MSCFSDTEVGSFKPIEVELALELFNFWFYYVLPESNFTSSSEYCETSLVLQKSFLALKLKVYNLSSELLW